MDIFEMILVYFKDYLTQVLIDKGLADNVNNEMSNDENIKAWLWYSLYSCLLCLISCAMTLWYGPGAFGSGVAEVIGYVNGVNYPLCIDYKTMITKIFGVTLAVAGGFTVGKEGPLAHIGANLGAMVVYIPGLTYL
jgi:H+/Cl- antiporter ClcA